MYAPHRTIAHQVKHSTQYLTQIILDCAVIADARLLKIDEDMLILLLSKD